MGTEFLISGEKILENHQDFTLVGRDVELDTLMKVLMRKDARNVILVGQNGVGCTALTYGLQEAKSKPSTPFDIVHKRIWFLDTDGLFSNPESTTESFKKMINLLSDTPDSDTVLVVEDTKDFVEAVSNSGNASFINTLMREVERGSFQIIFEVKDSDLDYVLNCHSNMKEMFTIMDVKEPVATSLKVIVSTAAKSLEKHHGIKISEEAINQAIHLTTTYPSKEASLAKAQPDASLTLLDRALATYRKDVHSIPPHVKKAACTANMTLSDQDIEEAERVVSEWNAIKDTMNDACRKQALGERMLSDLEGRLSKIKESRTSTDQSGIGGILMTSPEEQTISIEIGKAKKLISDNTKLYNELSEKINANLLLEELHVYQEFSNLSGIPFSKLNEDESNKLLNLANVLKSSLFGQDHVIDQVVDALLISRTAGLKERNKPDAAFMFCGSSGVGKTELAKQLAKNLKDDESALIRFDMSEYKEKFAVTSLIGAPAGFQGYDQGGILTNAVRKNPNSIILFDEIEKADPSIFDIFLQVLDDGRLTDTQGRVVSFEHTILLFTTNTGSENFLHEGMTFDEQMEATLEDLSDTYRAEFLNRFNGRENIVGFKVLPIEVIELIARGQINKLNRGFSDNNIDLSVVMDDEDISRLVKFQYKPARGARGIDGTFRSNVYPKFARLIMEKGANGQVAKITFNDGNFHVNMTNNQDN